MSALTHSSVTYGSSDSTSWIYFIDYIITMINIHVWDETISFAIISCKFHCHLCYLCTFPVFTLLISQPDTHTLACILRIKLHQISSTHSLHILLFHSCQPEEGPNKRYSSADRTWLSCGIYVMDLRAFSRTIDLSGADEERRSGGGGMQVQMYFFSCLFIFLLSSDSNRCHQILSIASINLIWRWALTWFYTVQRILRANMSSLDCT